VGGWVGGLLSSTDTSHDGIYSVVGQAA
jgi:hypothetical protein